MNVSLEFLFHYSCDYCHRWWSIADIAPDTKGLVRCPHCGKENQIEGITTVENQQPVIEKLKAAWEK